MKRIARLIGFILLLSGIYGSCQTQVADRAILASDTAVVYGIAPSQCGTYTNDAPFYCAIDLTPITSGGFYPTLRLTDNIDADTGGNVQWSTVLGPTGGYLGGGLIQMNCHGPCSAPVYAQFCSGGACITALSTLTVYFEGNYAPASGGGSYTGFATIHLQYTRVAHQGGTFSWTRSVVNGAVQIK